MTNETYLVLIHGHYGRKKGNIKYKIMGQLLFGDIAISFFKIRFQ